MARPQGVGAGRSAGPYTSDTLASAGTAGIVAAHASYRPAARRAARGSRSAEVRALARIRARSNR